MKIKIEKVKGGYRADFIELPGSPIVGDGKTPEMAVACLFCRNVDNLKRLDINYLEINGKEYKSIYKNDR